jgi:GT2 family glycosyltransferase
MQSGVELTIGILSYRRARVLERCVRTLLACTRAPFVLHIVNQGWLDDRYRRLYHELSHDEHIRITYLDTNVGCPRGRALLARSATTPFIFFADDDVSFTPDWDVPLLAAMHRDPSLGAVSSYLFEHKAPFFGTMHREGDRLRLRCYSRAEAVRRQDAEGLVATDFLPGGSVLMRREIFDEAAFDEGYVNDLEDLDLWMQLRGSRWKLRACLRSSLRHERPSGLWNRWARSYDVVRYRTRDLLASRQHFLTRWGLGALDVELPPSWLEAAMRDVGLGPAVHALRVLAKRFLKACFQWMPWA